MNTLSLTSRQAIHDLLLISKTGYSDLREKVAQHIVLSKPTIMNFMVNDICNSRCIMCRVWEKKRDKELTLGEFSKILEDPLFDRLTYIGVSGGEPTLRPDLAEFFRIICTKHPKILGTGLITNCLDSKQVSKRIRESADTCRNANIPFHVMLSLDGIGSVHDKVRGKTGSFDGVLGVIHSLTNKTDIPVTIGCTISGVNVWDAENVLSFCQEKNIYVRFRIAEFIDRLYNKKCNHIRDFNDEEKYQIGLFFSKLEISYEKNTAVRATYRNIRKMVVEGTSRESGCPYRSHAIGLDSRGNLLFCSPKSPILGSCLTESAHQLYSRNLHIRRKIISNSCPSCIHDYHDKPTMLLVIDSLHERRFRHSFSIETILKYSRATPSGEPKRIKQKQCSKILIVGWYGTETAGDKAIISQIIMRHRDIQPDCSIEIASLYPFITHRTIKELNLNNVSVVKTFSPAYLESCRQADVVIMGGGPLMGIESLGFILAAFVEARKHGIPTLIDGCGIGPLYEERHKTAVKEILRLSTEIRLRDHTSLKWVQKSTGRADAYVTGDPAIGFVKMWIEEKQGLTQVTPNGYFACFFREITEEYAGTLKPHEFTEFKQHFEDNLGSMVHYISRQTGLKPFLAPMHTFVIGGDDRQFARQFRNKYFQNEDMEILERIYSPQDILSLICSSPFNLCMRFHSVLFSETLNVPYLAIDYTGGGKIKGFLSDLNKDHVRIDREKISTGNWCHLIQPIIPKLNTLCQER